MKHFNYYIPFILLLIFLFSCKKEEKYPGYTQTDSGLYYQLLSFGDEKRSPKTGDYLEIRMVYKTMKDSIFFTTRNENIRGTIFIPFNHISFKGSFEERFESMSMGDSVSFIVNADSLFEKFLKLQLPFFLSKGEMLKTNVKLEKILSGNEYKNELELIEQTLQDKDMEEQVLLKKYLDNNYPNITSIEPGLYYTHLKEGTGANAESGKTVFIKYVGKFLDGKIFDNAYNRAPLEFTIGEQQQVIEGLEKGIHLMKEGGKTKFILSSQLAFGENGSSTGIVPSYTTVVYEVELLKVK